MRAYVPSTPTTPAPMMMKPKPSPSGPSLRVLAQLIQALEANAIRGHAVSPEMMVHDLDAVLAALDCGRPENEVLQLSTEANQAVSDYFASIGASIHSLGQDLEASIRSIAGIAATLSGPQAEYSGRLAELASNFQAARGLDDLSALRDHLKACITSLQDDTNKVLAAQAAQQAELQSQLAQLQQLATRTQEASDAANGPTAVILRFKRIQVLAERYGPGIGKQLRGHIEEILRTRWVGEPKFKAFPPDCLVLIDEQEEDICVFKHVLRKLAAERMVFNAKVDDREVMVRVGLDWTVVRLRNEAELDDLVPAFQKKFSSNEARENP